MEGRWFRRSSTVILGLWRRFRLQTGQPESKETLDTSNRELHELAESVRAEELAEALKDQEIVRADYEKFRQQMRDAKAAVSDATTPEAREEAEINLRALQSMEEIVKEFRDLVDERADRIRDFRFAHEPEGDDEWAAILDEES